MQQDEQQPTPAPLALPEVAPAVLVEQYQAGALAAAGRIADAAAARRVFADYRARKAANTRRAQDADLALFVDFLQAGGLTLDRAALASSPAAWAGVSHGLVSGFVAWLLAQGAAIGSVNRALSTVRVYAGLAAQAGALDPGALVLIKQIKAYGRTEGKRIDAQRPAARRGAKKAAHTPIALDQAGALKRLRPEDSDDPQQGQPNTPQGRRDALLMCLLLDHGLRVGEVEALRPDAINLERGEMVFYRPKVDKVQTHRLSRDTERAARAYLDRDGAGPGTLLRGSERDGELAGTMSKNAIRERVRLLGGLVGLSGLSPHDCRHFWASRAARGGTPIDSLRDAGGWSGLAMPNRYIEAAKVANERVRLEGETE